MQPYSTLVYLVGLKRFEEIITVVILQYRCRLRYRNYRSYTWLQSSQMYESETSSTAWNGWPGNAVLCFGERDGAGIELVLGLEGSSRVEFSSSDRGTRARHVRTSTGSVNHFHARFTPRRDGKRKRVRASGWGTAWELGLVAACTSSFAADCRRDCGFSVSNSRFSAKRRLEIDVDAVRDRVRQLQTAAVQCVQCDVRARWCKLTSILILFQN